MKEILNFLAVTLTVLLFAGCPSEENEQADVEAKIFAEWAGCRSSPYGMEPFPSPSEWKTYVNKMASSYKKDENTSSTGTLVWIVGVVEDYATVSCSLSFPKPKEGTVPDGLLFSRDDENEEYLSLFDEAGFSVWLQVEPGNVDIVELAKLVMNQYKNHKCVKGFGIDVEWYKNTKEGNPGTRLDDSVAQQVDTAIKEINSTYSLFVKHWRTGYLPRTYRGVNNDMIFVTDSQQFYDLDDMTDQYKSWADNYAPNPVFFQIGYEGEKEDWDDPDEIGSDEKIWGKFKNPLKNFGQRILNELEDNGQKRGIIWVDFTFKKAYDM